MTTYDSCLASLRSASVSSCLKTVEEQRTLLFLEDPGISAKIFGQCALYCSSLANANVGIAPCMTAYGFHKPLSQRQGRIWHHPLVLELLLLSSSAIQTPVVFQIEPDFFDLVVSCVGLSVQM